MEDLVNKVIEWVPEPWRPWVAIVIIGLYVVTKVRSMFKSKELNNRCKECQVIQGIGATFLAGPVDRKLGEKPSPKSWSSSVVDWLF